jgi:hypothetical protein
MHQPTPPRTAPRTAITPRTIPKIQQQCWQESQQLESLELLELSGLPEFPLSIVGAGALVEAAADGATLDIPLPKQLNTTLPISTSISPPPKAKHFSVSPLSAVDPWVEFLQSSWSDTSKSGVPLSEHEGRELISTASMPLMGILRHSPRSRGVAVSLKRELQLLLW